MPVKAEGNAEEYRADTVLQLLHHVHWYHMRWCSILRQNDERMIYPAGFVADELENEVTPLVETLIKMMQQPHGPAEKWKGVFDGTGLKSGSGEASNQGNGKGKGTGMWHPRPVAPTLDMEVRMFGKDSALYGTRNGIGRGKGKGFAEGKGAAEIVGAGMDTGGSASSDKSKGKGNCKWGSKVAGCQPWQRKQ